MTHVVAEPCVNCKFTDCVEVCPVDAFREGENCLVIDPDECIDCTLCVPQCPVSAIYIDSDLPSQWAEWSDLNAKFSRLWPVITKKKDAMAGHEEWAQNESKRPDLSERSGSGD
jgi:ferredoxin